MTARPRQGPGLLRRLLGISLLVTVFAVAGTALAATLVAHRHADPPRDQSGARAVAYSQLLTYAASHRSWRDADGTVRSLAVRHGLHVQIVDLQRHVLADATPAAATAAPAPVGVIDPLNVNQALSTITAPDDIYPLGRNPLALTARERSQVKVAAAFLLDCAAGKTNSDEARLADVDLGAPRLVGVSAEVAAGCAASLPPSNPGIGLRRKAVAQVATIATPCLQANRLPQVTVRTDYSFAAPAGSTAAQQAAIKACVVGARRVQLTPYVAPPVLLLIGDRLPDSRLGGAEIGTIVGLAAVVLVLASVVTVVASRRVARPLRALTEAVVLGAAPAVRRPPREVAELAGALDDSRRQREALEAERRELLGDIAHELRTPLANIRAWLEARRDGLADDPGLDVQLLGQAVRLQRVIDDLQLITVAESGQLLLTVEMVDLDGLLADVRASSAVTSGPHVRVDVDGAALVVRADPTRLRQILDNLMTNAIRAVESVGHGTVAITARREGRRVVITVSDDGCGLTGEELPHVFERFWRGEGSRGRHSGGSGLGLAIVRQLVDAHGGSVSVDSSPGSGTAFTVSMPAAGPPT